MKRISKTYLLAVAIFAALLVLAMLRIRTTETRFQLLKQELGIWEMMYFPWTTRTAYIFEQNAEVEKANVVVMRMRKNEDVFEIAVIKGDIPYLLQPRYKISQTNGVTRELSVVEFNEYLRTRTRIRGFPYSQ
jgi:hypothetical protein